VVLSEYFGAAFHHQNFRQAFKPNMGGDVAVEVETRVTANSNDSIKLVLPNKSTHAEFQFLTRSGFFNQ
jgi:hypothetical protein